MKIRPLIDYGQPSYPTSDYLAIHPELLHALPSRWRCHPVVVTALATVCALLDQRDCSAQAQAPKANGPSTAVSNSTGQPSSTAKIRTAPIFMHGVGRGSFGCMSVTAPTFLSEEEARQVITEEAKKAGINFKADTKELTNVLMPLTYKYSCMVEEEVLGTNQAATLPPTSKQGNIVNETNRVEETSGVVYISFKMQKPKLPLTLKQNLLLDGSDSAKGISFEYVSEMDFKAWDIETVTKEMKKSGRSAADLPFAWPCISSVSEYNFVATARTLQKGLSETAPNETVGVFYDPVVYIEPNRNEFPDVFNKDKAKQQAINASKEELRKQVRDFIAWLKAQGVI